MTDENRLLELRIARRLKRIAELLEAEDINPPIDKIISGRLMLADELQAIAVLLRSKPHD